MTVSEFFNELIEYIEQKADDPYMSKEELRERVIQKSCLDGRELDSVFKFLLGGTTVHQYVCERKMMAAYAHLVGRNPSKDTAVSIAGYADDSSFGKAFKERFKCTPKETMDKKDRSKLELPSYWDCISGIPTKEQEPTPPWSASLPMSPEEAKRAQEVWAWKAYYDMDGIFSDYACELSERMGCSLEKAFCYVNDLRDIGIGIAGWEEDENNTPIASKTRLMEFGDDPFFRHMFFEKGVLPSTAVRYDRHYFNIPPVLRDVVVEAPSAAVKAYHPFCSHHYYLPFELFVEGWDFYHNHADERYADEDLEVFYDRLRQCYSAEEAFYSFAPSGDVPTTEELDDALSHTGLNEVDMYYVERGEDPDAG